MNLRVVPALALAILVATGMDGPRVGAAGPEPRPTLPAAVNARATAAPPLTPSEAVRAFSLPAGFRIELVAAEPLVESPVSIAFDADGRLWVVEMAGFMPNVDGIGEDAPTGRVVVLEDVDGDGRMDKRTVFLDGLVLPRSIAFTAGGVLVAAPPELIFCRDDDKDDHCDKPERIASDYGTGKNPEHDANGLALAIDNWLYSANIGVRHRFLGGRWLTEPTVTRGQWGIGQDDFGRLFYNTNSIYLRADTLPVYVPDAHVRGTQGINVEIDPDQTTWPARPNTGVNRAYREGTLRADGTLVEFTAACGPHVYRGDQFPEGYRGNVFVAEPAANFVRRSIVVEKGPTLSAHNAQERSEFLTSTDERFRPVNAATGPDGALYVVDMYRGLIQHRIYLTPFLRAQIHERGLDKPVDSGRIWRVVSAGRPLGPAPRLSRESPDALVAHLSDANGWWRDNAQRLLVERGDKSVVPRVADLLHNAPDPRTRLHALFVLEGLGALERPLLDGLSRGDNRFVRAAAAGLLEREQIAALGALATELGTSPRLERGTLARIAGRELDLLARILVDGTWKTESPAHAALLQTLAERLVRAGREERTTGLLELVAAEPNGAEWRQVALLKGVAAGKRGERVAHPAPPEGWAKLLRARNAEVRREAELLDPWVTGHVGRARLPANGGTSLTGADALRFARGKAQFAAICGACHHPSGIGEEGKAPPLVDSPWVTGPMERLVRIALHGLRGPVRVAGRVYRMEMPSMGALEDAELADLLTYVRNEKDWGHEASPLDAETIARIRKATAARKEPWTAEELLTLR
jgi:glucose/arabinose dehydrogenase/mono/diheme cytochrome c family protein